MHLPYLKPGREAMETRDCFLGLNRNLRLRPGEFYDMENLTGDLFPILSPREKRSLVKAQSSITAMASRDGLCYLEGDRLFVNGHETPLSLDPLPPGGKRQLLSMGAYLLVLPDGKYYNTADPGDYGSMEQVFTSRDPVKICPCSLEGKEIQLSFVGPETPQEPQDRSYWLDPEAEKLKQYSAVTGLWVLLETPYVKLGCPGIGKGFSAYDGVSILGDPGLQDLQGAAVLHNVGEDFLVIPGLCRETRTLELPVTVERRLPLMDYCLECGNRLWGCRYGLNRQGQVVNEIYCSKLGDFKNFFCFLGISTDSYTLSLGSEGPFTGAVSYGGYPLFFKEGCIHKIFGTMPSNFSIQSTPCRGVGKGCSESLAIVNEVLYYRSGAGICAYDGSLPRDIAEPLGLKSPGKAAAGSLGGKYYISMETERGWGLYVYDPKKNLWHREDGLQAFAFCSCRDSLFCLKEGGALLDLSGKTGEKEPGPISWMAESGILGVTLPGNKYLTRLSIRMLLEPGSTVTVKVQYDSRGPFEAQGSVRGMSLRSFVFPLVPRRCDHMRIRLEGRGNCQVYSVTRVIRPGSDQNIY